MGFLIKVKTVLLLLLWGYSGVLFCETITPINELSFGTIVVIKNDVAGQISISTNNGINFTNELRVLQPGHRAEYLLTDYPSFTQVFVNANIMSSNTTSQAPYSEQFTLTALSTEPSITTDASGSATLFIGGTLQSSGNISGRYYDTEYKVTYQITVNY